jgi:hypothetical protein
MWVRDVELVIAEVLVVLFVPAELPSQVMCAVSLDLSG